MKFAKKPWNERKRGEGGMKSWGKRVKKIFSSLFTGFMELISPRYNKRSRNDYDMMPQ